MADCTASGFVHLLDSSSRSFCHVVQSLSIDPSELLLTNNAFAFLCLFIKLRVIFLKPLPFSDLLVKTEVATGS